MVLCSVCGAETGTSANFCQRCGSAIDARPGSESRRTVTTLFSDVTGFTSLAEHIDPEAMRGRMDHYFDQARRTVEAHGGVVEKFIGDAVMAVFGLEALHEDDAIRALRAAEEIRDGATAAEFKVRIGIATGEVIARPPASGQAFVTGDSVNVAARLQQAAAPGEVLVDSTTVSLAAGAASFEAVGDLELKGRRSAAGFRLLSVTTVRDRLPPGERAELTGRTEELAQLRAARERAVRKRQPYLFTVLGAPGVGKSRLVAEFSGDVSALSGRCLPYGEGITYWPVREMVETVIGAQVSAADSVAALAARLRSESDGSMIASRLAAATGWADHAVDAEEAAWAVRRFLEAEAAATGGLVVVVDDIQWAETRLLEVIQQVLDWSRDTPLLLICLGRPELLDLVPTWGGGRPNATTLMLEPLSEDSARAVIEQLAPPASLPATLVDRIVEIADGVPLFLEQLVTAVRQRDAGGGDANAMRIPETIQALLQARIDALPPTERTLLAAAAVIGQEFKRAPLRELTGLAVSEVDTSLLALMRQELVRPQPGSGDGYGFRHLLIRDAAYERISKSDRVHLHERLGTWLRDHSPEAGTEPPEIAGHHLEAACLYRSEVGLSPEPALTEAAVRQLRDAGIAARRRAESDAARTFFERAVRLTGEEAKDRLGLLCDLGGARYDTGDYSGAEQALDEAIRMAQASGDRGAEFRAKRLRVQARRATDPEAGNAEARELLKAERHTVEADGDTRTLAMYWDLDADVAYGDGRVADALASVRRAVAFAGRANEVALLDELRDFEIYLSLFGSTPLGEALELIRHRIAEVDDGSLRYAKLRTREAHAVGLRGDIESAREILDDAAAVHRGISPTEVFFSELDTRATLEAIDDNFDQAQAALREFLRGSERTGERWFASTSIATLACIVAQQGRIQEALGLAAEAEAIAATDDWWVECIAAIARTDIAIAEGLLDEALAHAEKAADVADQHEVTALRIEARLAWSRALAAAGQTHEAETALVEAKALAEGYGSALEARRVDRALEGLDRKAS